MPVLSVIIPVYNEIHTIEHNLTRVLDALLPEGFSKEIIIIDDYSHDGTRELLARLQGPFRILYHETNRSARRSLRQTGAIPVRSCWRCLTASSSLPLTRRFSW